MDLSSPAATLYVDRHYEGDHDSLKNELARSTTVYVGNLSFYTTEEQIYELFRKCGELKRIIMGLNSKTKTPAGFCFVEYVARSDVEDCIRYLTGTRLDDRIIRVDLDAGFREGRQFGRGQSGGQVRDELRLDYDAGRGGYGRQKVLEQEEAKAEPASAMDTSTASVDSTGNRGTKRDRSDDEDANERNPRFRGEDQGEEDE